MPSHSSMLMHVPWNSLPAPLTQPLGLNVTCSRKLSWVRRSCFLPRHAPCGACDSYISALLTVDGSVGHQLIVCLSHKAVSFPWVGASVLHAPVSLAPGAGMNDIADHQRISLANCGAPSQVSGLIMTEEGLTKVPGALGRGLAMTAYLLGVFRGR